MEYSKKAVKDITTKEAFKELKNTCQSLFSTVNKRIDRIVSSDVISPAVNALIQKRGEGNLHFTIGGKNFNELQDEWAQAIGFYNLQTGTLSGARSFTNELKEKLGEKVRDKDYVNEVFDLMHGIAERTHVKLNENMIGTNEILDKVIQETDETELSQMNSDEQARDDLISRLVDELTNEIDKEITSGVDKLDKQIKEANSRLF